MKYNRLIGFDWAMKRILRNKANFEILEGFLSELLKDDIKIQEILDSESNKKHKEDKYNRVDLLVKNHKSELVIIEVQVTRQIDYLSRMLYGTSKVIVENIGKGQKYKEVKKVISVNIVYFDIGQGKDYVYRGKTKFTGLHTHDDLKLNKDEQAMYSDKILVEDIYPEYYIIKVNEFNKLAKDSLDEWIYFLKNEKIESSFKARGIKKAKKELDILKLSEEERKTYQYYLESLMHEASMIDSSYGRGKREGHKEGHKEGLEQGKAEGLEQGKAEIVKKLISSGMSQAQVSAATGLSIEEIKKLMADK